MIGATIGCLAGGMAISIGRRKAGLIWQLLAIAGAGICMVTHPICFAIGRLLIGIAAGIFNNVMGKSLDETVPIEVSWQFGILVNTYIVLGLTFVYALGAILPTEKENFADDEMWRVILGMPAVIGIVNILLFVVYYRQEPVAFSVANGNEAEAKALLRRAYHSKGVENFDELINQKHEYIKNNSSKDTSSTGLCEAMFGAKYRRATWTCILVNSLHVLTGIHAVLVYISQLLLTVKEETKGEFPISPVLGGFIAAMINLIGCVAALIPMRLVGRKTIFQMGYGVMSASLFMIGFAYLKEWYLTMFIMVCVFQFIF